jgi:hypothetical protein
MLSAVKAVSALKRIDRTLFPLTITFYSELDQWDYDATLDSKVCSQCRYYEEVGTFPGTSLRILFPDHEIIDIDTIQANVHPNCRCVLTRKMSD